ncbi:MAG: hypothetical protein KC613_15975 [Myxococcales bacterium]|nr:hypothetical protein [Myxococcales bacterium]MCB9523890.1 hypothetical protein [Myxococcales bacterium]
MGIFGAAVGAIALPAVMTVVWIVVLAAAGEELGASKVNAVLAEWVPKGGGDKAIALVVLRAALDTGVLNVLAVLSGAGAIAGALASAPTTRVERTDMTSVESGLRQVGEAVSGLQTAVVGAASAGRTSTVVGPSPTAEEGPTVPVALPVETPKPDRG